MAKEENTKDTPTKSTPPPEESGEMYPDPAAHIDLDEENKKAREKAIEQQKLGEKGGEPTELDKELEKEAKKSNK